MELLLAVEVLSVAGLSEPAALNMLAALDLAQPLLASSGLGAVRYMLDGLAELLLAAELGGAVTVRRAVLSMLVRLGGADACCRGARNRISCTLMYSTCWSPLTSLSCCRGAQWCGHLGRCCALHLGRLGGAAARRTGARRPRASEKLPCFSCWSPRTSWSCCSPPRCSLARVSVWLPCFTRWPPCVSLSCCSPSRLGGAGLLCAAVLYRWVALAEPLLAVAVLAGQGI